MNLSTSCRRSSSFLLFRNQLFMLAFLFIQSSPFYARQIIWLTAFQFSPTVLASLPVTHHCVVRPPVFSCFLFDHTSLNVDISHLKPGLSSRHHATTKRTCSSQQAASRVRVSMSSASMCLMTLLQQQLILRQSLVFCQMKRKQQTLFFFSLSFLI